MSDHERIWLQNAEDAKHTLEGRLWCQDKVWPNDPGDGEPTEYVRADLVAVVRAEARREALEEAATVAAGWETTAADDAYMTCGNGHFWDPGTNYDQARADAGAAIRTLMEKEGGK